MQYTKIQPESFLGSGEDDFKKILSAFMGMEAVLFCWVEPFEQVINTLSKDGSMWNLVNIAQATFKNDTILYMYIASGKGR